MTQKLAIVTVTIDNSPVSGCAGMTILEVARQEGIDIPTLCYHQKLTPIGSCCLCVVEVEGSRTLVASCHTPVTDDMIIHTHSARVLEARRVIVELLLASHPDSCIVCDKASQCELRQIAADLDVGLPRFRTRKRYYPVEDISPYIIRDLSKCVLCRRCIRACKEMVGHDIFGMAYRGFNSKVVVDQDEPLDKEACRDCEACISLCPTGALSKPRKPGEGKEGKPLIISSSPPGC